MALAQIVAFGARAADGEAMPPGVATFTGSIAPRSVADFIALHRDEAILRVIVDSPGGDVVAALTLANWMVDRQVDVEVRNRCASSCANYLFAAGRRKIIDDRAIVVWHGSLLQKDFRARCAGPTSGASAAEAAYCADYRHAVEVQRAFFARVQVDEYVTRMGQEPTDYRVMWTMPVVAMARMGLRQVEARAGYGSPEDLQHFNRGGDDAEPIVSLGFDEAGNVVRCAVP